MPEITIPDLLLALAQKIEQQMIAVGSNPREPADVDSFVNGCKVSTKIKKLLLEEMDDE